MAEVGWFARCAAASSLLSSVGHVPQATRTTTHEHATGPDRARGAAAGRDPGHGAPAAAGRRLDRGAGGRRRPADRPAARPGRVRGQVDAGDPGPRDDPSRGRSRPAGPRRLGGAGRPAGRRPRARVARRADRADLPVAARAGGARARRRDRRPLRRRPRRSTQQAGAGGHAGAGSVSPGAEVRAHHARLPGATHRGLVQPLHAAVLVRPGRPARADGRALGPVRRYNLDLARAPSAKAATAA